LSTDGLLAGQMDKLDFSKRRPVRERTLLSTLNDVHVSKIIDTPPKKGKKKQQPIRIFEKNKDAVVSQQKRQELMGAKDNGVDAGGSGVRFLATGEKGDAELFAADGTSRYQDKTFLE